MPLEEKHHYTSNKELLMGSLYGYPILSKAGLGNILIPWADCLLWCIDNGAKRINPTWARLRLGPFFRNETDKRFYHKLFIPGGQICGLQKVGLLLKSQKVSAEEWRTNQIEPTNEGNTVVCFSDMNLFGNLLGRHTVVKSELYNITKPRFHPMGLVDQPFIGIHVRFGDYSFPHNRDAPRHLAQRLPIEWYCDCLSEIQRGIDLKLKTVVFSDGSDEELARLLGMENVSRSPFHSAITDMLALGESCAIITSRSTFSLWGSYLSQAPSVWYPGKKDVCSSGVIAEGKTAELEVEWAQGSALSQGFLTAVRDRVRRKDSNSIGRRSNREA